MGAVKRPALTRGVMALQIGFLLIGLAASLVPVLPKTHPFWGCNRTWTGFNPNSTVSFFPGRVY